MLHINYLISVLITIGNPPNCQNSIALQDTDNQLKINDRYDPKVKIKKK